MDAQLKNITGNQRQKNLLVLAAGNFLRGAHTSIYNVIWQPFALLLGASMPTIGLLNSIGGMKGIFPTIAQSLGGWMADRIGCKPFILAASVFMMSAYGLFILADLSMHWGWFLVGIVLFGMGALSRPAITSMTAESAKREYQGSMFSMMMFAAIVPGIFAPTAGGWVVKWWGYMGIFPILLMLETLALFLIWRYLAEEKPTGEGVNAANLGRALLRCLIPPKGLEWFFIATAADSFVWSLGWALITGMLKDAHHFSVAQLGMIASAMSLCWAAVQLPIGRYLDRHPTKPVLIFSELLGIPVLIITMTHPTFPVMIALQVPFAILAATWVPGVNTYMARAAKASERTESYGRLNMFRGLIAFPASWLGGLLYAKWGFKAPLAANLMGIFLVLAMFIFCVREPEADADTAIFN